MTEYCAKCGSPVYLRAPDQPRLCAYHIREAQANTPPFACSSDDFEETGDEGYVGLLMVLRDQGWVLYERFNNGRPVLWANSGSYTAIVKGSSPKERALKMFKDLYSDDPLAIACAAELARDEAKVTQLR